MHFEILIEDKSGEEFLNIILPQIIIDPHTFNIHSYRGIGSLPTHLNPRHDPKKRVLLNKLPKILNGYGKTFKKQEGYKSAVVVICDLDTRCLHQFRESLFNILNNCHSKPDTLFCIAIEEGEAWLLGDIPAILKAYPHAKNTILNRYVNDSICGTWECLADAVYPGGSTSLKSKGYQSIGIEKSKWALNICPNMDISTNKSQSFNYLKRKIEEIMQAPV